MNYYDISTPQVFTSTGLDLPNCSLKNRFIYVKHDFSEVQKPQKVLINPHFIRNQTVYINPNFKPPPPQPPQKPSSIHLNPNMMDKFRTKTETRKPTPQIGQATKIISTKTKFVRVPLSKTTTTTPCTSKPSPVVAKKRQSLRTKYKIVHSSPSKTPISNSNTKYKLDKRKSLSEKQNTSCRVKKRFVYLNKFTTVEETIKKIPPKGRSSSSSLKLVNISGVFYKKSLNSLKRQSLGTKKIAKINSQTPKQSNKSRKLSKVSPNKLRKCNIPCPEFRKFGKCGGKASGKCFKLHNPNQIILCTKFLQGACIKDNCLLSHKILPEKMPTCKYYLEGLCTKEICQYLHVKISPKAEICAEFLRGFCESGAQCQKRHQFLCPEFEKNKVCTKRRCPYPHGNVVRNPKALTHFVKKCAKNTQKRNRKISEGNRSISFENKDNSVEKNEESELKGRYYKEFQEETDSCNIETVQKEKRPKLGKLPSFISLLES